MLIKDLSIEKENSFVFVLQLGMKGFAYFLCGEIVIIIYLKVNRHPG